MCLRSLLFPLQTLLLHASPIHALHPTQLPSSIRTQHSQPSRQFVRLEAPHLSHRVIVVVNADNTECDTETHTHNLERFSYKPATRLPRPRPSQAASVIVIPTVPDASSCRRDASRLGNTSQGAWERSGEEVQVPVLHARIQPQRTSQSA
jgi:hypothetical protein